MAARAGIWAAAVAIVVGGVAFLAIPQASVSARAPDGRITIRVPGALTLSVHCGGTETTHAKGELVSLVPHSPHCHIEAPLSPNMPIRSDVTLSGGSRYVCDRDGTELVCRAQ
ncbi:MAG: hypothetical protein KTR31_00095 [Myxococcales bacterium]|nr:hypothetical protein [Myxococcales bacterium]